MARCTSIVIVLLNTHTVAIGNIPNIVLYYSLFGWSMTTTCSDWHKQPLPPLFAKCIHLTSIGNYITFQDQISGRWHIQPVQRPNSPPSKSSTTRPRLTIHWRHSGFMVIMMWEHLTIWLFGTMGTQVSLGRLKLIY